MARKLGQSVLGSFLYLHRQTNRWPSFRSKLRRTTKSPVWTLLRAPHSGLPPPPSRRQPFDGLGRETLTREAPACLSPSAPLNSSPCGPGSRRGTSDTASTEKSCLGERGSVMTNWGLPDFSTLGCIWEAFFEQG